MRKRVALLPKGHLVMSGDILVCHNWEDYAIGI